MGKTRFDRIPRDPLKELVAGRQVAINMSSTELAERAKMTREHLRGIMRKPSTGWTIGDAIALTAALDIPIAEMREAIRR